MYGGLQNIRVNVQPYFVAEEKFRRSCLVGLSNTYFVWSMSRSADTGVRLSGISYDRDLYTTDDRDGYLDTAPGDEEEDYEPMPSKRSLVIPICH